MLSPLPREQHTIREEFLERKHGHAELPDIYGKLHRSWTRPRLTHWPSHTPAFETHCMTSKCVTTPSLTTTTDVHRVQMSGHNARELDLVSLHVEKKGLAAACDEVCLRNAKDRGKWNNDKNRRDCVNSATFMVLETEVLDFKRLD